MVKKFQKTTIRQRKNKILQDSKLYYYTSKIKSQTFELKMKKWYWHNMVYANIHNIFFFDIFLIA